MAIHSIRCEELENINLVSCEKDCEDIHSHPRQPVKMEPSSSYEHAQVRNHGEEGSSQRTSLSAGVSNEQLSAVTEECWQKSVSSGNELPVGQDAMEQSGTQNSPRMKARRNQKEDNGRNREPDYEDRILTRSNAASPDIQPMKKTSGVQSKKFSRGQFSADEDSQNTFRMSRWSFLGGEKKIPSHDASSSDNQMYPDHSNEISSNASEVPSE